MSRPPRAAEGGIVYHVWDRAAAHEAILEEDGGYEAVLRVVEEAAARVPMRILDYCVLPDHFHLVLWPRGDGDLSRFMGWLTMTHTQRWYALRRIAGSGILIRAGCRRSRFRRTTTSLRPADTSLSAPVWCRRPRTGAGVAFGSESAP